MHETISAGIFLREIQNFLAEHTIASTLSLKLSQRLGPSAERDGHE
jgi:hypothetical protein